MFKRLTVASALLLSLNAWALNCSNPVTISDPRLDGFMPYVVANEKGEAAVFWITDQLHNRSVTVAHKTQTSSWSSPEIISGLEANIGSIQSFIGSNGGLSAAWKVGATEEHVIQGATKQEQSWSSCLNLISCPVSTYYSDIGFDALGKLVCACKTKISYYKPKKGNITVSTQSLDHPQSQSDVYIDVDDRSTSISHISLAADKSGSTYVFWQQSQLLKHNLFCQKIRDGSAVSDPEFICELPNSIHGVRTSFNEQGDLALLIDMGSNSQLITKIGGIWSSPDRFLLQDERAWSPIVVIDNHRNIMVTYKVSYNDKPMPNRTSSVKVVYKPFDQSWKDPVVFSDDNRDNEDPLLDVDKSGNFIIVWHRLLRNHSSIFGAVFSPTTEIWSEPQRLSPEGQPCIAPSFTFYAPGKGYICWMTRNGFDPVIQVAELSN